jgi:hypothetical protein
MQFPAQRYGHIQKPLIQTGPLFGSYDTGSPAGDSTGGTKGENLPKQGKFWVKPPKSRSAAEKTFQSPWFGANIKI